MSFKPPWSGGKMPISRISLFESLKISEMACLPSSTLFGVVSLNSWNSAASNSLSIRSLVRCAKAIDSLEGESLVYPRQVRPAAMSRVASAMTRFIFRVRINQLLILEFVILGVGKVDALIRFSGAISRLGAISRIRGDPPRFTLRESWRGNHRRLLAIPPAVIYIKPDRIPLLEKMNSQLR